jgi:hypothetical protein
MDPQLFTFLSFSSFSGEQAHNPGDNMAAQE